MEAVWTKVLRSDGTGGGMAIASHSWSHPREKMGLEWGQDSKTYLGREEERKEDKSRKKVRK